MHVAERLETHLLDVDGSRVLCALAAGVGLRLSEIGQAVGLDSDAQARLGLERLLDALASAGIVISRPC